MILQIIYNAVLRARDAVFAACKPGADWRALHLLANRVVLEDLITAGLLQVMMMIMMTVMMMTMMQGSVDQMMEVNLAGRLLQPHGLGHFMGCDVHDVGGYLEGHPERSSLLGLRSTSI